MKTGAVLIFVLYFVVPCASLSAASLIRTVGGESMSLVLLEAIPDQGTVVYAIEDQLPEGVYPRDISEGGRYDTFLNKVKWGPFFDDQTRVVSYELVVSIEQEVALVGAVSWDGLEPQAADGPDSAVVPGGGFYSWILERFGVEALLSDQSDPTGDLDNDHVSLLGEFAFGLDPFAIDQPLTRLRLDDQSQLELSIQKRDELGEVTLKFWRSIDMLEWSEFDPGETLRREELGDGIIAVDYAIPRAGSAEFFQLRLSLPE